MTDPKQNPPVRTHRARLKKDAFIGCFGEVTRAVLFLPCNCAQRALFCVCSRVLAAHAFDFVHCYLVVIQYNFADVAGQLGDEKCSFEFRVSRLRYLADFARAVTKATTPCSWNPRVHR